MDRTLLIKVIVLEADVNCHLTSNFFKKLFQQASLSFVKLPICLTCVKNILPLRLLFQLTLEMQN